MLLLHKDETAMQHAYPVAKGVSAAMTNELLSVELFRGACDTDEEAAQVESSSNAKRMLVAAMMERSR